MKSFLYGVFAFAFSVIAFLVWIFMIEKFPPLGVLLMAYLPWGIIGYYWWRLWKSERHERLVL